MEEMYESPRSRLGRKGYIKRWLTLFAIGVVVGIGRTVIEAVLPAEVGSPVSVLVLVAYGLPAAAMVVVWTMHRAADAGKNEAMALLMFVPIINILTLLAFSVMESAPEPQPQTE